MLTSTRQDSLQDTKAVEAEGRAQKGITQQALENWSTTTRIVVQPLDAGRSMTKSTAICDHDVLGMGKDNDFLSGSWWELLVVMHIVHDRTSSFMSPARLGYQYLILIAWIIGTIPGWPIAGVVWAHSTTLLLSGAGTKLWFRGQPL